MDDKFEFLRPLPDLAGFEENDKFTKKTIKILKSPSGSRNDFNSVVPNNPALSLNPRISEFAQKYASEFEVISFIGTGSFGDVFKVRSKEDNQYYAVKWSKKRHRGNTDRKSSMLELYTCSLVANHPHLVEFIQAWEEHGHMLIQSELCEHGNLEDLLSSTAHLEEKEVWNILLDITLATKWLHDQQFLHLDIKPDNIFRSASGMYKLGDFGLSQHVNAKGDGEGDSRYLAPEVLSGHVNTAADIFSIGASVFEASENIVMPSQGVKWNRLRKNPPALEQRTSELTNVVHGMLSFNSQTRPSVDEVLRTTSLRQLMEERKWPAPSTARIILRRTSHLLSFFWMRYYDLAARDLPMDDDSFSSTTSFSFSQSLSQTQSMSLSQSLRFSDVPSAYDPSSSPLFCCCHP